MYFGLDIGGTTLKAVAVDTSGAVVESVTRSAGGQVLREQLFAVAREALLTVANGTQPAGIGLAFGGLIQPDGTMTVDSTNLPNLADLPLASAFADALGAPCLIEHDGRAAMRGEAWTGAARDVRNAMTLTLGTGIGAGLLLDGRIHEGAHGGAGEVGVWRLLKRPETGPWPSVEDLAAPASVSQRYNRDFGDLFAAWRASDESAAQLDNVFGLIGRSIANAHLLLDLEMVVLIGGVTALGEPLRQGIESAMLAACPQDFQRGLAVRLGTLGAYAGAVGAASLWREAGHQ